MEFETVIGLEIHVQLNTKSKMFCRCPNAIASQINADPTSLKLRGTGFNADRRGLKLEEPNTRVCEVCMGMPGVLPVTNKQAILWVVQAGLALGCKINNFTKFDRKHYFYPDLPKGYQISQYDEPIAEHGKVEVEVLDGEKNYKRKVGITRVHLEEDAGKLVHPEGVDYSLVDLNRAGTPLLEIVTKPDIRSPKEARIFAENLHSVLRYLGVSEANMEQGNLRVDANISLRKKGIKELGAKVEVKNMNSFKALERALVYEEERQKELLSLNKKVVQETRGWDDAKGKTILQRTKEEAQDYRYFPEPDIPPLNFKTLGWDIEKIKKELPEMPVERGDRFEKEYQISPYDAEVLTSEKELADFFENTVSKLLKQKIEKSQAAKRIANWMLTEFLGLLNKEKITIKESKITEENLAELLLMIEKGKISGKIAKEIFEETFRTGKPASEIIKAKGIKMISTEEIEKVINKVIKENPKSVEDYKKGKTAALGFLVGQVMRATKGQSYPQIVNDILKKRLK